MDNTRSSTLSGQGQRGRTPQPQPGSSSGRKTRPVEPAAGFRRAAPGERFTREALATKPAGVLRGSRLPAGDLQRGSKGSGVEQLQTALVKLKYMPPAQMATGPGTFGPKTQAALKKFQKAHGVPPIGRYGPKTRAAFKRLGATIVPITPPGPGTGPLPRTRSPFINRVAADAIQSQRRTGVPASVTLAQAVLESGWGRSKLATRGNNFFGIKGEGPAGHIIFPTKEFLHGRWVTVHAKFRKYHSPAESFVDHGKFLRTNRRYARAFRYTNNAAQFAREIHKAGYATDPGYSTTLISLIKKYGLERFDAIGRSRSVRRAKPQPVRSEALRPANAELAPEQADDVGEPLPPEPDVVDDEVPEVVPYEQSGAQDDEIQPAAFVEEAAPRPGARGFVEAARHRTPAQVVAWAKHQHDIGASNWHRRCLVFARKAAAVDAKEPYAITAWQHARYRHTRGTPPPGSFVFWRGGSSAPGHVAVSIGGGYVWSTDIRKRGHVDRVSISYVTSRWDMRYLGWTEDVNGVRILGIKPPPPSTGDSPHVKLENLRPGKRNADVKTLQTVLRRKSKNYARLNPSGATGLFGKQTRAMVLAFQQAQGWHGSDADGVPGPKTCARLGLALA